MAINLISYGDLIHDIYSNIVEELKLFLQERLDPTISIVIFSQIGKSIKTIFVAIIMVRLISTVGDIKDVISSFLTHKECYNIGTLCYLFWKQRYPNIVNLIQVIEQYRMDLISLG